MTDPALADRPKSRSLQPLRALLPFLQPYRGTLLLALGALLVAAAAMLALPVALRYLIDEGMAAGSSETINRYFIAFLAAAGIFGVFATAAIVSIVLVLLIKPRYTEPGSVASGFSRKDA